MEDFPSVRDAQGSSAAQDSANLPWYPNFYGSPTKIGVPGRKEVPYRRYVYDSGVYSWVIVRIVGLICGLHVMTWCGMEIFEYGQVLCVLLRYLNFDGATI